MEFSARKVGKVSEEETEKRLMFHRDRTNKVIRKMIDAVNKEFGDVRSDDFEYMVANLIMAYSDRILDNLKQPDQGMAAMAFWSSICGASVPIIHTNMNEEYNIDAAIKELKKVSDQFAKFWEEKTNAKSRS